VGEAEIGKTKDKGDQITNPPMPAGVLKTVMSSGARQRSHRQLRGWARSRDIPRIRP